eukprot:SAG31_NODE_41036_length_278_cov_0.575419_1_plen_26_part_01
MDSTAYYQLRTTVPFFLKKIQLVLNL